jgi:hypothetical protein
MLITLAYRLPRSQAAALLGSITAYPLTEDFRDAWSKLPARRDYQQGRLPSYSSLATGLCAATGQPVRLFGERDLGRTEVAAGTRMLLLTSQPFDYRLAIAVSAWEQHIRGDDTPGTLARLLPPADPARPLDDYAVFRAGGVPEAPGWVFRIAAWQVMRHLAGTVLRIDGRSPLSFRLDTDGSLLAWDAADLITSPNGTARAMARITVRLVTNPGISDLVLCFSAHLSRLADHWARVKNTWIARDAPGTPVMRLPVHHRHRPDSDPLAETDPWRHLLSPAIPKIIEACELEPLTLPSAVPALPGRIRPQAPAVGRPRLGSGLGPRFMLRLHEHITEHLPGLQPLGFEPAKRIKLARREPAGTLTARAIDSTGCRHLTILCLYATPAARTRMLTELQELAGRPLQPCADGQPAAVSDRLTVITCHCPAMLAHGPVNRTAMLAADLRGLGLERGEDRLVTAWAETEFHPAVPIARDSDAKPHLRRLLAHRGIPCQFLATEPLELPPGARPRTAGAISYAQRSALQDLLRTAGILDHRIQAAAARPGLDYRLDRPALFVGIHARRQQASHDDPPLVLILVAVHATPDPDSTWHATMYSDRQGRWLPIAAATADFHAGRIGDAALGRTEEKAARTRMLVEKRLAQLAKEHSADMPMVIFTDGPATRTIWPGLQDQHFGLGPMPGDSLRADGRDIAIVRSNNSDEIGRPVTRQGEGATPRDPLQPAAPGRRVYQLQDSMQPSWLFPGISKTYGAMGGATGARYTRWTLPDHLASQLRKPWHSYTATEITVPAAGSWEPAALAALTARLCEQPVSWDGRVVYATPLHLAVAADKDHPDYREATTQAANDDSDDEASHDEDEVIEDTWTEDPGFPDGDK